MPKLANEMKASQLMALPYGTHAVGGVPGLALDCKGDAQTKQVRSRIWVLRATVAGQRRWIGIGPLHTFGLSEARERARALRQQIYDGIDPLATKRKAKAQAVLDQVSQVTFDDAAADFIEGHRAGWKSSKHADQWTNTLASYVSPTLGSMPVSEIAPSHVFAVLRPIWNEKNETATRVQQRIEKVIAAADAQAGRERQNPARWKNNLDAMLPAPNKVAPVKHHEALPYKDLPKFMKELAKREGMAARALAFTILTAARSGEVRGMTWVEINLKDRLWIVPGERMKSGREHRVPLTDEAITLLPPRGEKGELVYPSPTGKAFSDAAMSATLKRMGVAVTVHGFRSTFKDWATETTHHPDEVSEMALGHSVGTAVERAYRRGDMFEKRRALAQDWAAYATKGKKGRAA